MNVKDRKAKYYQDNKEKLLEYQKERYKKLATSLQDWKNTLKCSMCGMNDSACLDFHHSNPKDKETGVIRQSSKGLSKVLEELRKCVVVCANCHRKAHAYNIETDPKVDDLADGFQTFIEKE